MIAALVLAGLLATLGVHEALHATHRRTEAALVAALFVAGVLVWSYQVTFGELL